MEKIKQDSSDYTWYKEKCSTKLAIMSPKKSGDFSRKPSITIEIYIYITLTPTVLTSLFLHTSQYKTNEVAFLSKHSTDLLLSEPSFYSILSFCTYWISSAHCLQQSCCHHELKRSSEFEPFVLVPQNIISQSVYMNSTCKKLIRTLSFITPSK